MRTFFQEDEGQYSIIRLGFFIVVVVACGLAIYFGVRGNINLTEIALVNAMLTIAFGGKVVQKKYEPI